MNKIASSQPAYQNQARTIAERVEDLLRQMTLAEKIAQLGSVQVYDLLDGNTFSAAKAKPLLANGIGQVTRLGGWSLLTPLERARVANQIQKHILDHTRLGIPAMIHDECCSGYTAAGATRFPQMIGLASTWEPELAEQMTAVIRSQMRSVGSHQGLSPVLDVLRDPRWGRSEETFGEDPFLITQMGTAYVRGLQGDDLKSGVIATGKHFAAHSIPEGGMNCTPVHLGMREFREVFLPPFQAAIQEAGLASIMNSYSELDGQVIAAARSILTDLLRGEMGFDGVLVSDYLAIEMLHTFHAMAADYSEAAALALKAGIDVELPRTFCYADPLIKALECGTISLVEIDTALQRVLTQKFQLGLFETPFVEEGAVAAVYAQPEQADLARRIAADSLVLLKNANSLLPLSMSSGTIALIGPNAASGRNLLGDYSYPSALDFILDTRPEAKQVLEQGGDPQKMLADIAQEITSLLAAVRAQAGEAINVLYAPGCEINSADRSGFDAAVQTAKAADVVILALGDKSGLSPDCTSGEFRDRDELGLPGVQADLVSAIAATGKPLVVVMINGRVLALPELEAQAGAILEAWLPGEEGASAIAAALFGKINPGGKLPVSLPRSVGQLPIYYNHKPSGGHSHFRIDYVSRSSRPLYPFGHGLSYTRFEYADLEVDPHPIAPDGVLQISLNVKNVGSCRGSEVVQLYIRDEFASIPRPVMELKGFERIALTPGEQKRLVFHLPADLLAFVSQELDWIVEPGSFQIMIGSSSEDIRLKGSFLVNGATRRLGSKRAFQCRVEVFG